MASDAPIGPDNVTGGSDEGENLVPDAVGIACGFDNCSDVVVGDTLSMTQKNYQNHVIAKHEKVEVDGN